MENGLVFPSRKTYIKGMKTSALHLLFLIAVFLLIGSGLGAVTAAGKVGFYDQITRSVLTPPDWVFGVVWSSLYVMIATSLWYAVRAPNRGRMRTLALSLFAAQMGMNWIWTFLFFTFHWLLVSFLWIVLLDVMVAATIWALWRVSRLASILLIPYLMWGLFAAYLSGTIWLLN